MTVQTRSQRELDVFNIAHAQDQAQQAQVEAQQLILSLGSSSSAIPEDFTPFPVDGLHFDAPAPEPNGLEQVDFFSPWSANEYPDIGCSNSNDFDTSVLASDWSTRYFPAGLPPGLPPLGIQSPFPVSAVQPQALAVAQSLSQSLSQEFLTTPALSSDPPLSYPCSQQSLPPPLPSPSPTPSNESRSHYKGQSVGTGGRVDKKRMRSEKRLEVEKRSHNKKRDAGNQLVAFVKENVAPSEASLVKGVADAATRAIEIMTDQKAFNKAISTQLIDERTRTHELSIRVASLETLVRHLQQTADSRKVSIQCLQGQIPKREDGCLPPSLTLNGLPGSSRGIPVKAEAMEVALESKAGVL